MKQSISHIKTETDGVTEESFKLCLVDIRYPSSYTEVYLSVENAMELLRMLDTKLANLPL